MVVAASATHEGVDSLFPELVMSTSLFDFDAQPRSPTAVPHPLTALDRPTREQTPLSGGTSGALSELLDLLGHAAMIVRDRGRHVIRTRSLEDLLLADPGAPLLVGAMRELAGRTQPRRRSSVADLEDDSGTELRLEVHTARSRYLLRRVDLEVGTQPLTVVVVELADPASGVADVLRTRYRLTMRELQVVRALATGQSLREVAEAMRLSTHTVRHHTERIYRKLEVHSRAELAQRLRSIEQELRRRPFAG